MNSQEAQNGPAPAGDSQAHAQAGGAAGGQSGHGGMYGGFAHGPGMAGAMAGAPWAAQMAPPWQGPHPYPYGYPYAGAAPGWGPPGWVPPVPTPPSSAGTPTLGILNNRFVMGMVVGGALTYVLTNEAIQRAAIRGVMQVWLNIQGGIEETKERFRDAESEIKAGRDG